MWNFRFSPFEKLVMWLAIVFVLPFVVVWNAIKRFFGVDDDV